jgi:hypothetical protein
MASRNEPVSAEDFERAQNMTDRTCPECGEQAEISNSIINGAIGYRAGQFHCVCECGASFMGSVLR